MRQSTRLENYDPCFYGAHEEDIRLLKATNMRPDAKQDE